MKVIFTAGLCAGLLAHVTLTHAGSNRENAPTFADMLEASGLDIGGYVDTSYTYLSGGGAFTSGTPDRVFDREHNSFNLNLVDIYAGYQPDKGFGGFVQLDFGSDANIIAPVGTGSDDEIDVQEAYLQYALGPVTLIGGKFATLAGYEVIESPDNLNFNRSILFGYAIPFTHTGARAVLETAGGAKFTVGVNNGWDVFKESSSTVVDATGNTIDTADGKTVELGASIAPTDFLSVSASAYSGDEPGTTEVGRRNLIDVIVAYTATEDLSFALNGDVAYQADAIAAGTDADWHGVAGYANYQFTDQWRAALRGEWFDDEDGFRTGVAQQWKEVTGTLAYTPIDAVEIRAEARRDWSDADSFVDDDASVDDNQYSVALEAIYKY